MKLISHPSPNFGPRKNGLSPSYVMIHYTAMESAGAALERMCDPEIEVSAHYLIGSCGMIWQLVDEDQRAWHAGAGSFNHISDMNSASIGIELDNYGNAPFAPAQMEALITLLKSIRERWFIPPQHVIAHSDYAPGRKQDPGPWFDWSKLEAEGLAFGFGCRDRNKTLVPEEHFKELAQKLGYTAEVPVEDLLCAIRLRSGTAPYYGNAPDQGDIDFLQARLDLVRQAV